MNHETIAAYIADGKAVLGIEFGSTQHQGGAVGADHAPIASGDHTWENRLEGGIWTYHLDDVWAGVQDAFANLQKDVQANYGVTLTNLAAFGVSGMMHGFLAFDENGRQLAQFRTWRNTMTAQAAEKLTDLLGFNIPQRWSIAHLVQAMMNGEAMVPQIHHLTTLAGYVHYQLCGKNCLGIGEARRHVPHRQRCAGLRPAHAGQGGCAGENLPHAVDAARDSAVRAVRGRGRGRDDGGRRKAA